MGNKNSGCRGGLLDYAKTVTYMKKSQKNVDSNDDVSDKKILPARKYFSPKPSSPDFTPEFRRLKHDNVDLTSPPSTSISQDSTSLFIDRLNPLKCCIMDSIERSKSGNHLWRSGEFSADIPRVIYIKTGSLKKWMENDESLNWKNDKEPRKHRLSELMSTTEFELECSEKCRSVCLNSYSSPPTILTVDSPSVNIITMPFRTSADCVTSSHTEKKCIKQNQIQPNTNNLSYYGSSSLVKIGKHNTGMCLAKSSRNSRSLDACESVVCSPYSETLHFVSDQSNIYEATAGVCVPSNRIKTVLSDSSPLSHFGSSDGYDSAEIVSDLKSNVLEWNDRESLIFLRRDKRKSDLIRSLHNWRVQGWSNSDEIAGIYKENESESVESVELNYYHGTHALSTNRNNRLVCEEVGDQEKSRNTSSSCTISELSLVPLEESGS